MILRKPYAFLIKYFRLIHTILVILMCYLLYRTNLILNFFNEYISSSVIITGKDFTGSLFNTWMFILPFIIILILGILLGVMIYKKKPKIFYIINILVIITVLVFYNIGYDTIGILEGQTMETRTLRLMRDLFVIVFLLQGLSLIFTFIRATGFDIKKFDFRKDLQELDISEEDAEEFEVAVNFETSLFKREFRKNIRFAKYVYIENRFIINGLILILFLVVCFVFYMNLTIYNKTYKQGTTFSANEFSMSINNSYLTNQDYKGKQITDNYLLIVELNIKAHYDKVMLNTAKVELKIKDNTYHPNKNYSLRLLDLGMVYSDEYINYEQFEKKILVYEIPKGLIKEQMMIKYIDDIETNNKLSPKYIKTKLDPYNLDLSEKTELVNVDNDVVLNEKLLKKTSINLTNFEIKEKFVVDYRYCKNSECYDSIEYINPILNTNYDKVLLKIDGDAFIDEELKNKKIYNLYTIINHFGKIRYQLGRKTYYFNTLSNVLPKKTSVEDSYYIEIPKEVMSADKVSLVIDVRDKIYEYVIK